MDLATLWVPSDDDHGLRARYRDALRARGWSVGAWRRTAVSALREGFTHACLPTAAGTFFVPPHPFDLGALSLGLSRVVPRAMLVVDDHALRVYAHGAETGTFARWGSDPRAIAAALGVPRALVATLLDADEAERDAATPPDAESVAWELTALKQVP